MSDLLNFSLPSQETVLTDVIKNNPYYIDIKGSVNICLIRCGQEIDDCNSIRFDAMTNYGKMIVLNPDPGSISKCNIKLAFDSYNDNIDMDGTGNYKFEKIFFTIPSLHKLNGNLYDMETFLVFSSVQKNGNVLYICLCVLHNAVDNVASNDNKLLNFTLINNLFLNNTIPQKYGTSPIGGSINPIDLNNFVPPTGSRNFYDYTHPYNNQVNFRVFQTVMSVSTNVLNALKLQLFPGVQGVPLNTPTLTPMNDYLNFKSAIQATINPSDGLFFYFSEDMTNRYSSLKVNTPINNTSKDTFENMNSNNDILSDSTKNDSTKNKKIDNEINNKKKDEKKIFFKKLNVEKDDFTLEENIENYDSDSTPPPTKEDEIIIPQYSLDYYRTLTVIIIIGFIYLSNLISYNYIFRFFQNSDNMSLSMATIVMSFFYKQDQMKQYESNSSNRLNEEDEKFIEKKYPIDYTLGKLLTMRILSTFTIVIFTILLIIVIFLLVYNKFIGNTRLDGTIFSGKVLLTTSRYGVPILFVVIQLLLVFILFIIPFFVYLIYRYILLRMCRLHDDYYYKVENYFYNKVWKVLTFRKFIFFVFYNDYTSISSLPIIDYETYKKNSIDLMEKYEKYLHGKIVPSTSDESSMDKFRLNQVFDAKRFDIYDSLRPKKEVYNYSDTTNKKIEGVGKLAIKTALDPYLDINGKNKTSRRLNIIEKLKSFYFELAKHCKNHIETYSVKGGIYLVAALILYSVIVIMMNILLKSSSDNSHYGIGINFLLSSMVCFGVYIPFIILFALFFLFFIQNITAFMSLFSMLIFLVLCYYFIVPFCGNSDLSSSFYFGINVLFYLVIIIIYILYIFREKLQKEGTSDLDRVYFKDIVTIKEKIFSIKDTFMTILYDEDSNMLSSILIFIMKTIFHFQFLFFCVGVLCIVFTLIMLNPDDSDRKSLYRKSSKSTYYIKSI
jgi:hypothetical protein